MKRVLVILLVSGFYTLSAGESFALPPCPEDTDAVWDNCFGTYTHDSESKWAGDKYVGEFKEDEVESDRKSCFWVPNV